MNSKDKTFHESQLDDIHATEAHNGSNCKRSRSSWSVDDSSVNNLSSSMYQSPLERFSSTSALGYCTSERRGQCPKGNSEKVTKFTGDSIDSFGLSDDLSTESIRRACEYFDDDVSDNDLIEVHNTPGNFQSRQPNQNRGLEDSKIFIKRNNSEEKPLCVEECPSNELTSSQHEDAFSALRELDAVLDIHDESLLDPYSSASQAESDVEQNNIEDCLLDLDDYLDKMEESITQNCKSVSNSSSSRSHIALNYEKLVLHTRGHILRRTLGCTSEDRERGFSGRQKCNSKLSSIYATLGHGHKRSAEVPVAKMEEKAQLVEAEQIEGQEKCLESRRCTMSRICDVRRSLSQSDCSNRYPASDIQVLTDEQIFQNLIEQNVNLSSAGESRPRQYGRRAERNSRTSMPNTNLNPVTPPNDPRPMSAPAVMPLSQLESRAANPTVFITSDESTGRSSRNTSPVTIASGSDSSDLSATSHNIAESSLVLTDGNSQQCASPPTDLEQTETTQKPGFNTFWPHDFSRTLALISCTLGLFNVCRFAVLTINYGANFIFQFLLLSLTFGVPFFWLQMCLGAKIKAGPVSMWKISPICSGIGISLVLVQYFLAIYSSVVIVWLLVYMGDTFFYQSSYRWLEISHSLIPRNYSQAYYNLTESIPDYYNINVLQRLQVLRLTDNKGIRIHISDRLAFYLAILWTTVFLILCKGLKTFGKAIFIVGILPLLTLAVVTGKLLYVVDLTKLQNVFSSSELDDFLINSKSWIAAAQETFFTWGLLGASTIAITSRSHKNHSQSKDTLRRDAALVVLFTLIGLCLSALVGLCCIQILNQSDYVYAPGSYEKPNSYSAVYSLKSPKSTNIISYPTKYVPHYSSFIGEIYRRHADVKNVSGYQVLRLVTELFPAVVSVASGSFSWIWAAVVFVMLFVFGIAQLCAMWKPISSALGNSTSSVLLSCVTGLLLSIPFATEVGITLLHYMDILIGGAWFIPILWAAEIFGVFLIRGRPYNGDDLVNDLKLSGSASAFLALSWNVLLPIGLVALAIIEYKVSLSSQLYYWRGRSYYGYWARKVGALTQIGFLLLIPITAIIQIYRYLTSGPPDILDRIQMLYRPLDGQTNGRALNRINREDFDARYRQSSNRAHAESGGPNIQDDAPPKYTPPPSYTTATGARLAKILRQSIRRSVRRLLGDSGRSRLILATHNEQHANHASFPPDYSSILTNPSITAHEIPPSISETIEISSRSEAHTTHGRSLSLGRKYVLQKHRVNDKTKSYRPSSAPRFTTTDSDSTRRSSRAARPYTAEDVITTLRSSTRRRNGTSHSTHPQNQFVFRSIENLVLNAEPPDISSTIMSERLNQNDQNNTSVI